MQGRAIVLDTETTGLSPKQGHRLVEIGAIVLQDGLETSEHFHCYINPQRSMPDEALRVHGLTEEFLSHHAPFSHSYKNLLTFVGDSPLIIHNAPFDMKFLTFEFQMLGVTFAPKTFDTLPWARRLFPGAPASLDALCRRFRIDNRHRDTHGALVDAKLLAQVYACMTHFDQKNIHFTSQQVKKSTQKSYKSRCFSLTLEEKRAHHTLCESWPHALWHRLTS